LISLLAPSEISFALFKVAAFSSVLLLFIDFPVLFSLSYSAYAFAYLAFSYSAKAFSYSACTLAFSAYAFAKSAFALSSASFFALS
jgi:hypothetical protein